MDAKPTLNLTSPVFLDGGLLPQQHTADGADLSPPLCWAGVPQDAKSLVVLCEQPEGPAKGFVHWVLFDITPTMTELHGQSTKDQIPQSAKAGTNDFGELGYAGPRPAAFSEERYAFKIYALDKTLDLELGATRDQVVNAMENHILAQGQLVARYQGSQVRNQS